MDSFTINGWLAGLGRTYGELVSEGTILNLPLKSMFDTSDNEDLLQNPAAGVKLWFWADSRRLKKVMITLIQTVGQPVYTGQLPEPFALHMDRGSVRNFLGEPNESKLPVKLPGGLGMRSGSDTYYLTQKAFSNVKVTLSYLENLSVNNISFSLIKETGKYY
ncbi:DUF6392 family protein [Pseudomonas sp. MWU16-30323]|jgi:hypothetical protein|uniref:DUF6392 family protein n=1 Tax=Pseudomonas sp. MWU16-30323 TaxID=2878094 RepID=UPI001CFBB56B|nr:DUF6392 family protein [Pseudomonas sp. MWU16-30323]